MEQERVELQTLILEVTDLFYQNRISDGMTVLPELLGKMESYMGTLCPEEMAFYVNLLNQIMQAMEMKDYILASDILIYEWNPRMDIQGSGE